MRMVLTCGTTTHRVGTVQESEGGNRGGIGPTAPVCAPCTEGNGRPCPGPTAGCPGGKGGGARASPAVGAGAVVARDAGRTIATAATASPTAAPTTRARP